MILISSGNDHLTSIDAITDFSVKFELKSGKRLTRPLGHAIILRLILESAASLGGTRDKERALSPLVCTRLAIKNIARV